jgi:hypothetical protein
MNSGACQEKNDKNCKFPPKKQILQFRPKPKPTIMKALTKRGKFNRKG